VRQRELSEVNTSEIINPNKSLDCLRIIKISEWTHHGNSGITHKHVYAVEARDRLFDHKTNIRLYSYISGRYQGLRAGGPALRCDGLQGLTISTGKAQP